MVQPINVSWTKTKKNVEQIISKYVYYSLSVDNSSTSDISEDFLLQKLDPNNQDNTYVKVDEEEKKQRMPGYGI